MVFLKRAWTFFKHEFLQVLPPTIFFLISFNIVVFTTTIVLEEFSVQVSGHAAATVLALVIGKVVLVIDKLPFVRRFDRKPAACIQPRVGQGGAVSDLDLSGDVGVETTDRQNWRDQVI